MNGRSLIAPIACGLLFLSLAATTLPRLIAMVNTARTLLPLTYSARRERLMGPWYSSVKAFRGQLPASESVALITGPHDRDAAVFASYYLYPIRTRIFVGRNEYRNATPDPTRPKTIATVTWQRVERTSYDALRDRDLRAGPRVVSEPSLSQPASTFVLPIAASLEGPAPETFVIEATLANPSQTAATVRMTFWPKGIGRTMAVPARATLSYYDFVHQLFGMTDRGWMRIDSSQPLRAAFYFANRGRHDATLLPNVTGSATAIAAAPLRRDTKLFIVNPSDGRASVVVAGETIPLDPHAFIVKSITALPPVSGDVYAFVTTRELNGRTDFLWPAK
jgi:hypothetical protein